VTRRAEEGLEIRPRRLARRYQSSPTGALPDAVVARDIEISLVVDHGQVRRLGAPLPRAREAESLSARCRRRRRLPPAARRVSADRSVRLAALCAAPRRRIQDRTVRARGDRGGEPGGARRAAAAAPGWSDSGVEIDPRKNIPGRPAAWAGGAPIARLRSPCSTASGACACRATSWPGSGSRSCRRSVFPARQNAFGEGIGERLTPPRLPQALVPRAGAARGRCPRAPFLADPELTRNSKNHQNIRLFRWFREHDLEPVVCRRHAEVAVHLDG